MHIGVLIPDAVVFPRPLLLVVLGDISDGATVQIIVCDHAIITLGDVALRGHRSGEERRFFPCRAVLCPHFGSDVRLGQSGCLEHPLPVVVLVFRLGLDACRLFFIFDEYVQMRRQLLDYVNRVLMSCSHQVMIGIAAFDLIAGKALESLSWSDYQRMAVTYRALRPV